jgi:hypothetical protein
VSLFSIFFLNFKGQVQFSRDKFSFRGWVQFWGISLVQKTQLISEKKSSQKFGSPPTFVHTNKIVKDKNIRVCTSIFIFFYYITISKLFLVCFPSFFFFFILSHFIFIITQRFIPLVRVEYDENWIWKSVRKKERKRKKGYTELA